MTGSGGGPVAPASEADADAEADADSDTATVNVWPVERSPPPVVVEQHDREVGGQHAERRATVADRVLLLR